MSPDQKVPCLVLTMIIYFIFHKDIYEFNPHYILFFNIQLTFKDET
jgi:hypothetical protein